MTITDLLTSLIGEDKNCQITVWIDGNRYFADSVDLSFTQAGIVEINVKED